MKVYKDLFGNGSKINASEVVAKNLGNKIVTLDTVAMRFLEGISKSGDPDVKINLKSISSMGMYLLTTHVGSSASGSMGVYFIHNWSSYESIIAVNDSSYVAVTLSDGILTLSRYGPYRYGLLKLS